jgi:hypothetical protein
MATSFHNAPTSDWVSVGKGPFIISGLTTGSIYVSQSATKPTATDQGHVLGGPREIYTMRFRTSETVWVRGAEADEQVVVTLIDA